MVRLSWSSPIFGMKMLQKSSKFQGPAQCCNTARAITWLVGIAIQCNLPFLNNNSLHPVADLGGGMGGMHPPTSLKVTILAEKSASISNNLAPFRDASPPTSPNVTNPAENSLSISVKTFFFFFFFFLLETT